MGVSACVYSGYEMNGKILFAIVLFFFVLSVRLSRHLEFIIGTLA